MPRAALPAALLAALALVTTSAAAQAPQPAPPAPQSAMPGDVTPKISPLLTMLLGRVLDAAVESSTGDSAAGLFRRLAGRMKGEPAAPVPLAPATVGTTGLAPALGWAMEQLDPASFAVMRPVPVAGAGPMLRTGDVFVLQFSTNLPGQVRLENTDPAGRVADLGTYNVLVDQLNRLPRDRGIQLQGQPGLEKLRFYFYPCMPPEAAGKPWAGEFQGKLPPCAAAAPLLQTASLGAVVPRALVNLSQPDTTMVFAAATDYTPGEVTAMEAQIRHEPKPVR